jgi:hypothetical protein
MDEQNADLAHDLLRGVSAISQFTGDSPRRTYYLIERKLLPVFRHGGKWCARRSTLREFFRKLEAGAAGADAGPAEAA